MRCSNQIESQWRFAEVKQELTPLTEDVCRESFLAVSRATKQHEVASCTSNGFDLIVHGAVFGMTTF